MRKIVILTGLALAVILLTATFSIPGTHAQQQQCFTQTGHCISGRIAQYWNQNGGLDVFGYPLSDQTTENGRTVQYFERQRFELHPENAAPYDVLLGLLGEDVLQQRGIDWHIQQVDSGPQAGCLWFPDTKHNVCDQTPGNGFMTYWQSHGLDFDGQPTKSYAESLALFGLPVTGIFKNTANGETYDVQWFERARFEWHPNNPDPYKVLLGRLGAEFQSAPPPQPTPAPQAYTSQDTPTDVLASFYDAINKKDYRRAYGYWENPPTGYDQFAQGYADTAKVQVIAQPPTFIDAGAGNLHASIPTVLVSTKTDGSQQTFAGCYTTHKVNIQPDVWHLAQAQIAPVDANTAIPTLLAQACAAFGVPGPAEVSYASQNTPVELLASFYNAINRQEYQRAYSYWENPPTSYDQFAQGYANTASVQLIVQLPPFLDTNIGNNYGRLPTVLVATQHDGSQQVFSGCYMTHKATTQSGVWHISGATIIPGPANQSIPSMLAQGCPSA